MKLHIVTQIGGFHELREGPILSEHLLKYHHCTNYIVTELINHIVQIENVQGFQITNKI